jgi:hypothetical protein
MIEIMAESKRPPILENAHILIVTAFPPSAGGSSILMQNLLSQFAPDSYTVVSFQNHQNSEMPYDKGIRKIELMSSITFSSRVNAYWWNLQLPWATWRLKQLIKKIKPSVVVAVFPFIHMLEMTRNACRETTTPWMAYLHDTIVEALSSGVLAERAKRIQEYVFSEAASVMLMSDGMVRFYGEKYQLECKALPHSYPEVIPTSISEPITIEKQGFFSGGIYEINGHALARVAQSLYLMDYPLFLTSKTTTNTLEYYNIPSSNIRMGFLPSRDQYLNVLQQQDFLILALSWPDESPIHQDELATIFPTKTPEYLASGRPILVHCPEYYFLARFFRENNCGFVVSERSLETLIETCTSISEGGQQVEAVRLAALRTAQKFSLPYIAGIFQQELQRIVKVSI